MGWRKRIKRKPGFNHNYMSLLGGTKTKICELGLHVVDATIEQSTKHILQQWNTLSPGCVFWSSDIFECTTFATAQMQISPSTGGGGHEWCTYCSSILVHCLMRQLCLWILIRQLHLFGWWHTGALNCTFIQAVF